MFLAGSCCSSSPWWMLNFSFTLINFARSPCSAVWKGRDDDSEMMLMMMLCDAGNRQKLENFTKRSHLPGVCQTPYILPPRTWQIFKNNTKNKKKVGDERHQTAAPADS